MYKSLMILSLSVVLGGFTGCEVQQTEEGEMPKVDVEAEPGKMPAYDVDAPEVDVKTEEKQVTVPDVDVDTEERTVTVPDVDVTPADEDND